MKLKLKDFGLTLVLFALFVLSVIGQYISGFKSYNEELIHHGLSALASWTDYISTGHFISSIGENMESEFLQMALFVFLTMCFVQKGSAESKKPPEEMTAEDYEEQALEERFSQQQKKRFPILWRLYENSLTITLIILFLFFFVMHAWGSFKLTNEENLMTGQHPIQFLEIFSEAEFWFESFQNWQSEFFSIAAIVLLSVFLRQKGSPQSKKLTDSHFKTGDS